MDRDEIATRARDLVTGWEAIERRNMMIDAPLENVSREALIAAVTRAIEGAFTFGVAFGRDKAKTEAKKPATAKT